MLLINNRESRIPQLLQVAPYPPALLLRGIGWQFGDAFRLKEIPDLLLEPCGDAVKLLEEAGRPPADARLAGSPQPDSPVSDAARDIDYRIAEPDHARIRL